MSVEFESVYLDVKRKFILDGVDSFFDKIDASLSEESDITFILSSFRQNLFSAFMVGTIPYQLATKAVLDIRFSQILSAERIRTLRPEGRKIVQDENSEEIALENANNSMKEELRDHDVLVNHKRNIIYRLHNYNNSDEIDITFDELLRQVLVMSWGSFEIFINDVLRESLNRDPSLLNNISNIKPYKEIISSRNLLEGLRDYSFDLSKSMGNFLSSIVSLDSIEKMQSAIHSVFEDKALTKKINDVRLRRIFQQRNLIVHRRGLVDFKYKNRIDDEFVVGEKISFEATYVQDCMALLRDVGCDVYIAAQKKVFNSNT
ncbi:hypothetical protein [Oceanibaculum indicum]|uniref:hypothetical protein n=1 Tax=Oceanibaculum indicum TaxID=526216 RepID=UPI0012E9D649|nr:hypothetical protein [Oceanibaculum indicum]